MLNHDGMKLNARASTLVRRLVEDPEQHRIEFHDDGINVPVVDCGVQATGSIRAGVALAEISSAGLASIQVVPGSDDAWLGPAISFQTDQPVASCLAAQYAGWKVNDDGYFAMASGPMRAAAAREDIFDEIGYRDTTNVAVGVLESGELPPPEVCRRIADECNVEPRSLTVLVAPTASLAGTVQIVARSVETALHKLHTIGFDVHSVVSGWGVAPLPPIAKDDLAAIGRTNDAIIYGGRVELWVDSDDDLISDVIKKVPSNGSSDYGQSFQEIFKANDGDFYKIDPLLFSPACIRIHNLKSGRFFEAGQIAADILSKSFSS